MKKGTCTTCGDTGITIANPFRCEDCGKSSDSNNIQYKDTEKVNKVLTEYIPKAYCNEKAYFNISIIQENNTHMLGDETFNAFCKFLNRMYEESKQGMKPNTSFIIYAPHGFGKVHWIYSLMREYANHGMSVTPFIDLEEYVMLKRGVSMYQDLTLRDIILADVGVFKVPQGSYSEKAYIEILDILDKRGRKGKISIFVTSKPMNVLVEKDAYGELLKTISLKNAKAKTLTYIKYKTMLEG